MKRKKNNLINDKNFKKKIVVIGAVFFIISVGLNSVLGDLFPLKIQPPVQKINIPEDPEITFPEDPAITFPEENDILPIINERVVEILKKLEEDKIKNKMLNIIREITCHKSHPTATRILTFISKILKEKFDLKIEKVADLIISKLRDMDIEINVEEWEQDINLKNWNTPSYRRRFYCGKYIEATIQGTNVSSDEIYLLVVHYDSWYEGHGASCASSVAAALVIAELLSEYKFEHDVRILFVDGELQDGLGLKEYLKKTEENNDNIVASFFMDSIGNPGFCIHDDNVIINLEDNGWISDFTRDVNSRYEDFLNFELNDEISGPHNHHEPFLKYGYPAICISGADFGHIPNSSDTIDNIDVNYAIKITKLVTAIICELALGLSK